MSSFALFVLIIVIVAGFLGWRSGLMKQIGKLAGVILGIIACRIFAPTLVAVLCNEGTSATDTILYTVLAYVILFIVVYIIVSIIMSVVKKLLSAVYLGFIDKIGGALFRIVEWLLFLSLLLNLWVMIVPDTQLIGDALFDRILWFGPYLLGTEAVHKVGAVVSGKI